MAFMYTPTPKCTATDYINFIIASPKLFSCTEAAKVQPEIPDSPAHDAFTRLLIRLEPDPEALWEEARPMVHRKGGMLVLDDSTTRRSISPMPSRSTWSPGTGPASTTRSSEAST